MSEQENCKKSTANRDYSFNRNIRKNNKFIKSTCVENGDIDYFHSLFIVQRDLKVNCGVVKMCCEELNRVQSGKSKLNENFYKFEYISELPDKYNREIKVCGIKYKTKNNKKYFL